MHTSLYRLRDRWFPCQEKPNSWDLISEPGRLRALRGDREVIHSGLKCRPNHAVDAIPTSARSRSGTRQVSPLPDRLAILRRNSAQAANRGFARFEARLNHSD